MVNKKVKQRTVKAAQGVACFLLGLGPETLLNRTRRDIEQGLRFPHPQSGCNNPSPLLSIPDWDPAEGQPLLHHRDLPQPSLPALLK